MKQEQSILPIVSGGLDSSTLLWYLKSMGFKIPEVITFNYGQKHEIEVAYAKNLLEAYGKIFGKISHSIVDISSIGQLIAKGALTGEDEVPHDMYDSENQRITIVPNRNMILLSIAAGRAVTLNVKKIGYAAHKSDFSVYPDCRPEFIEALDKALVLGNLWDPVNLVAPFQHKSKSEIVKIGLDLKIPYNLTWSCYEGKIRPCLQCGTCIERTEAFHLNQVKDPSLDDMEWQEALRNLDLYKNKQ